MPTQVKQLDGKYFAIIKSLTNNSYAVVWHPLAYSDVTTCWAKDAINDMGSRMVIEGTGGSKFSLTGTSPAPNLQRVSFMDWG